MGTAEIYWGYKGRDILLALANVVLPSEVMEYFVITKIEESET